MHEDTSKFIVVESRNVDDTCDVVLESEWIGGFLSTT